MVRSRQPVVSVVVVCLITLAVVSCATRLNQSRSQQPAVGSGLDESCSKKPALERPGTEPTYACRAQVDKDDRLLVGGYEQDGMVHFVIGFDTDVEDLQKTAFRAGMKMWNDRSKDTGFFFEENTAKPVDFRVQKGPHGLPKPELITDGDCAGYGSPGSFIWYSPTGMGWVTHERDIPAASRVYAHELGHALNLCHKPGTTSIMNAGDPDTLCAVRAQAFPPAIPDEDARDARICGHGARAKKRELLKSQTAEAAVPH